jgi:hypothetical protein
LCVLRPGHSATGKKVSGQEKDYIVLLHIFKVPAAATATATTKGQELISLQLQQSLTANCNCNI